MLGYYDLALTYNMRAQEIFTSTNDIEHMAVGLGNMGNLYLKMGQNEKALESFQKAISISSQIGLVGTVAINLSAIGSLYNEEEKFDLALQKYFDALQIYQSMNYEGLFSSAYSNIALAYLNLGKSDSALENAHTSLSFAVEQKNPVDLVYASRVLYLIYLKQQNPQRAFEQLTRIRQLVLKGIETSFFSLSENEREPYLNQQTVFLDAYHDYGLHYYKTTPQLTDTMYNMVLGIKGLSMRSSTAMRTAILNSNDSLLLADYDALIALKKKIADGFAKGENTSVSESEARELEKKIIKQSGLMSNFEKLKNTDWKIVQKSLDKDAAAIEFYHFKSTIDTSHAIIYMALIITHDCEHPILVELCTEDDLKKIFGAFQGNNLSFVERVYGKKSEAKRELYEKIWQPLEPYLQDVKTVYYSPSGLLHKVSFAAICKEQDVYLSDVYNFRQMGSTGNLAFENNTEFGDLENFLLMGGVQYNSDTTEKEIWNYLPGSLAETDAINSYLNKKKYGVNYFKETNASEAIFKEKISSSSIVHIATHGFFFPDPEQVREEMKSEKESDELKFRGTTNYANWSFVNNKNPLMRSGIVLANANDVWQRNPLAEGEDGILTAQEVSNLDLRNTKLVVLSACETGLGDIKGSEGVYGLQRAFKMAGVKYLIMSLWQVPDKETSEFMILFYKNLIKEKDIPTAFQKTQKLMREKYDPYYWGAFILIE
jgi:CHAT domain-containing protein